MNTSDEPDFRWSGPADPDTASEVRRAVQGWAARTGLPAELADALTLASYEAIANAVEHAYAGGEPGLLSVRIGRDEDDVVAVVSDHGTWRAPRAESLRGRGLALMEAMAKEMTVTRTDGGTTVELRWTTTLESGAALPAELPATLVMPTAQQAEPGEEDVENRLHGIEALTDPALARIDTDAMTQEMLSRLCEVLTVDTATVLLYDRAAEHLLATASVGIEEEVRQGVRVPYGYGFVGTIAATRLPLIVDHVDPTTVLNPLLWKAGLHALLGVPMMAGGELMGVLHVGSRERRPFTEHDISMVELAAERLALAIQAQVARAEHAAANALQRSLMPGQLPVVPGYDFATRYVPSATLGVGGDWYDVFSLPGNRIGIVIGDVSGHGLAAAVVMGRLRSALRAYALDNDAPSEVLDKLDRKAHHFEAGAMATVAYGVIDLDAHQLQFCLAGHLPPVIAAPGRTSAFADAPADPPIGFNLRGRRRREHLVDLPPGGLVCFYTDGLIERSGQPIDRGLEVLPRIVSPDRAEAVCAMLMARFVGADSLADDVAVLIAHRVES